MKRLRAAMGPPLLQTYKNGVFEMSVKNMTQAEAELVEPVKVLKPVRVVPNGKRQAVLALPGDVVYVAGMIKLQLIYAKDAELLTEDEAQKLLDAKSAENVKAGKGGK
jgi:hypothetical protein